MARNGVLGGVFVAANPPEKQQIIAQSGLGINLSLDQSQFRPTLL